MPDCPIDFMSSTPNVFTVPTPTGNSTPLISNISFFINLPDVCLTLNTPPGVPFDMENPMAPLLFPTISDVTGISASVISVLFKIKLVFT